MAPQSRRLIKLDVPSSRAVNFRSLVTKVEIQGESYQAVKTNTPAPNVAVYKPGNPFLQKVPFTFQKCVGYLFEGITIAQGSVKGFRGVVANQGADVPNIYTDNGSANSITADLEEAALAQAKQVYRLVKDYTLTRDPDLILSSSYMNVWQRFIYFISVTFENTPEYVFAANNVLALVKKMGFYDGGPISAAMFKKMFIPKVLQILTKMKIATKAASTVSAATGTAVTAGTAGFGFWAGMGFWSKALIEYWVSEFVFSFFIEGLDNNYQPEAVYDMLAIQLAPLTLDVTNARDMTYTDPEQAKIAQRNATVYFETLATAQALLDSHFDL